MPALAVFGIENDAVNTAVTLLLLFLIVLWLALVFYTYKDAVRRIGDPMLVGTATGTSLIFPFVGTVVYLILRPPEYLDDVRERELEIAAAEARLLQMHEMACPFCAFPVEKSFLRCPSCLKRLKEPCATCRKPLDPRWKLCPYCEAEIGQAAPAQLRRRRVEPERERAPAAERVATTDRAAAAERSPTRAAPRPEAGKAQQAAAQPAEARPATRAPSDGAERPGRQPAPRPSTG